LTSEHLALACASHSGARIHTDRVERWLHGLGLSDGDLRCGPQLPNDRAARAALREAPEAPGQIHNNCSGKHSGFLTLSKHLGGGPEYIVPDHPVQKAVRAAFEEMTGEASPGFGIDGCSAPNFATSLRGLARAAARMAAPAGPGDARSQAAQRLVEAMMLHPELIAGEGRCCTEIGRLLKDQGAIKTGAEGVFVAILPKRRRGVALKIADGATRASEAAMVAILVGLGLLDAAHPLVARRMNAPVLNRRGIEVGNVRAAAVLSNPRTY
ncbi:MAG: asparaginase, partial [Paracoccaceae bacterium]